MKSMFLTAITCTCPSTNSSLFPPTEKASSFREYMKNLDQLVVYVDDKIQKKDDEHDESYASGNMCNYISSKNNALFNKKLVLQCVRSHQGRYVLIEAWGRQIGWSRLFGAVLCEVQVFS